MGHGIKDLGLNAPSEPAAGSRGRYQTAHLTDDLAGYHRAYYERHATVEARKARFCRTCGNRITVRAARYCSMACRIARDVDSARHVGLLASTRELVCARPGCSVSFTTRKPNRRYCSSSCRLIAQEARHRSGRGAGRRFPRVRYAQRRRILERDGWRCRICAAPIDPELRFPHPGAASIDHVDPDGEHVDENVQAAHLACNVAKGRKLIARAA